MMRLSTWLVILVPREVAFYAPMKSPNHPVPSGDRTIARGLMKALEHPEMELSVALVSELRIYDKSGDAREQAKLREAARAEVARLIPLGRQRRWPLWVTYHNYYKAPDLIGPEVSRALRIPYVIIEASVADKRLSGPWSSFEYSARAANTHAACLFSFTSRDAEGLAEKVHPHQKLCALKPFLQREELPLMASGRVPQMITVAMMRDGDKLKSYQHLAAALAHLDDAAWRLLIVGDGAVRKEVETLFSAFGTRVVFAGQASGAQVSEALSNASLFLWPGVGEAFGMSYLEAQARGLPVIAESRAGVTEVVHPQGLVPAEDGPAFAARIRHFLDDTVALDRARQTARAHVETHHLLPSARRGLWQPLLPLLAERL